MIGTHELLQPSWPLYNYNCASLVDHSQVYGYDMDTSIPDQHGFSSSFTTEESSEISFDSYFATTTNPDNLVEFLSFSDEKQVIEAMAQNIMDGLEPISGYGIGEVCGWMDESDGDDHLSSQVTSESDVWSPCPVPEQSMSEAVLPSNNMTLNLPRNNIELDNQLALHHLLRAYGEAMENGHKELAEVIVKRINERINPFGEPIERVAFNLFQTTENQGGYLRQQSSKNFETAFKAFYQCFPYSRFAHFSVNSAILEALPNDAETVHIVDFDMGVGIQWPPMIEAISRTGKNLRLTSIRTEDERSSTEWRFDETRQRLYGHAQSLGVSMQMEEITLQNLQNEIERMKRGGGLREWTAFNCMIGLPHMERRQSRSQVVGFLKMAREVLTHSTRHRGIIAFGDGEAEDNLTTFSGYASFFKNQLIHYQALLESMECNFPVYLSEARIAMESLFVAPYICSRSWYQNWKETREALTITGNDGWRISSESLIEAQEIVKEKESLYKVKIRGERENEMVLEWKDIQLVRVSLWA